MTEAMEDLIVAEAHLAYWRLMASADYVDGLLKKQEAIVSAAMSEMTDLTNRHARAPAAILAAEKILAQRKTTVALEKSEGIVREYLKTVERLARLEKELGL